MIIGLQQPRQPLEGTKEARAFWISFIFSSIHPVVCWLDRYTLLEALANVTTILQMNFQISLNVEALDFYLMLNVEIFQRESSSPPCLWTEELYKSELKPEGGYTETKTFWDKYRLPIHMITYF